MRLLTVIGGELIGIDERSNWATLNALVAVNGPASIQVHVLALVRTPAQSMVVGNPLGRAVSRAPRWNSAPTEAYNPSESARGRLDRALEYLRSVGVRGDGDIEPGDPYPAIRKEVEKGGYDRVLLLGRVHQGGLSLPFRRDLATRLRRCLDIPVDAPQGMVT